MRGRRRPPPIDPKKATGQRINERIRIPRIFVIDHEGVSRGEMATEEALRIAREVGLDLVEVQPTARPPVCRIMNYGQYKYEQHKRAKANRSHQAKIKEIRLHPRTGEHDIQVRLKQARDFLGHGDKVQILVQFKGREIMHKEHGIELCKRFEEELTEVAKVEKTINLEGKRMTMLFAPLSRDDKARTPKKKEVATPNAKEG